MKFGPNIVTNGLVSCLDASNAKSYSGSGTKWYDLVSNCNADFINGITYNPNKSLILDGVDDYISIKHDYILQTAGRLSVSFWVKFLTTSNYRKSLYFFSSTGYFTINHYEDSYFSSFYTAIWDGVNYYYSPFDPSSEYRQINKWYNVCVTIDNRINLYVNGVKNVGTSVSTIIPILITNSYFSGFVNWYTNCELSTHTFYNRSLSDDEVLQNYNATKTRFN